MVVLLFKCDSLNTMELRSDERKKNHMLHAIAHRHTPKYSATQDCKLNNGLYPQNERGTQNNKAF